MRNRASTLLVAWAIASALSGCGLTDFVAQHAAIAQAHFSLDHVDLAHADVPFATPDGKADLLVYLKVVNPNAMTAKLDQLDTTVSLEGSQIGVGKTANDFSVDAGATKVLPLGVSISYQGLASPVLQALLARKATVEVQGTSHLSTPFGRIDTPIDVSQSSRF